MALAYQEIPPHTGGFFNIRPSIKYLIRYENGPLRRYKEVERQTVALESCDKVFELSLAKPITLCCAILQVNRSRRAGQSAHRLPVFVAELC